MMRPVPIARRTVDTWFDIASPAPDGLVLNGHAGELVVLDDDLAELSSGKVEASTGRNAFSAVHQRLAVSGLSSVMCLDPAGSMVWEFPHVQWGKGWGGGGSVRGSCFIDDAGRVWATAPTEDSYDCWMVLDGSTGQSLAKAPLRCYMGGATTAMHPDGQRVGLFVGMGQDGQQTYWARFDGSTGLVIDKFFEVARGGLTDVHPSGRMVLTDFSSALTLRDLDTYEPIAVNEREDISTEFFFEYDSMFLDEDTVLAHLTDEEVERSRHVILRAADLSYVEDLHYPQTGTEFADLYPVNDAGCWLTYQRDSGELTKWRREPK